MDRRKVLLIAAALVALLGTALVFLYVRGADVRAEQRFETVKVLRAVQAIEPGEAIEAAAQAGKLQLEAVPREQLLGGHQTSIDDLSGTVALTTVYPGEQIITDRFGGATELSSSSLPIPKKKLAASVELTDVLRVSGFVNPGSEVAVFWTGAGNGGTVSRVLLNRVSVIGVGSTTPVSTTTTTADGEEKTEELPRTLMTLSLSQKEVEKIRVGEKVGELSFALLTDTSAVTPGLGTAVPQLFN